MFVQKNTLPPIVLVRAMAAKIKFSPRLCELLP
jgi:hypothetical protein